MYALFEDAGKFQTGRILSEAESSAQIELESGKRLKVKAANILLKFEKPTPSVLMAEATALSATMELDLADRKSTRLNSSHSQQSRMPSSA